MLTLLAAGLALASEPPPKINATLNTGMSASADAAVIIGNEDYAVLPDVPYAERDMALVYETLLTARGIPAASFEKKTSANREEILRAVEAAADKLGEGGTLWVYFSGHGAASKSSRELLLIGFDAKQDPQSFEERSVSVKTIADRANAPVVFVLDTCYAGYGRDGAQLIEGTHFTVPPELEYHQPQPVTVWMAAGPDQVSGPYGPAKHSLFTYLAMGALRGWADGELSGERDKAVTLDEANAYINRALETWQVDHQTAQLTGDDTSLVVVEGRNLEKSPRLERLVAPSLVTLDSGGGGSVIPPIAASYASPITHVRGRTFEDAYNVEMGMKKHLFPIAEYDKDGKEAVKEHRRTRGVHAAAVPLGAIGLYSTYLFASDLRTYHTMDRQIAGSITAASAALAGGMIAWEAVRLLRQPGRRDAALEAANRVVNGEAL